MDPLKWHDCERGDVERVLKFLVTNLLFLRQDRYSAEWWTATMDRVLNECKRYVNDATDHKGNVIKLIDCMARKRPD
jgi:hypothetical protein